MNSERYEQFRRLALRAEAMRSTASGEYWAGYERGLRRAYHGERFGTQEEHELWLSLAGRPDATSQERARGYRDGLEAM